MVIATQGVDFVSSSDISEDQRARLSPCSHVEADTRLVVHCSDLARMNHTDVMIRNLDTDVVVLATAHYHSLQLENLWVAFVLDPTIVFCLFTTTPREISSTSDVSFSDWLRHCVIFLWCQ